MGVKDHSLAHRPGWRSRRTGPRSTSRRSVVGASAFSSTAALEADTFDPTPGSASLTVSGGGPSGIVLDPARARLYVLTRFDNAVSVVDLGGATETAHLPLHNPEPPSVVVGRPFLYDAAGTSNGEAACASCHIFGDMDDLAWDLGNPDDAVKPNPIPMNLGIAVSMGLRIPRRRSTARTGRRLPSHDTWQRRHDGAAAPRDAPWDRRLGVRRGELVQQLRGAFVGLVGRDAPLAAADMQKFTDFILQATLPPNPNRVIHGSLTSDQAAGKSFFLGPRRSDGLANDILGIQVGFTCDGCHTLYRERALRHGGAGQAFESEEQIVKNRTCGSPPEGRDVRASRRGVRRPAEGAVRG